MKIKKITRQEIIATARRYSSHIWTATQRNSFHGRDPDGILIATPNQRIDENKELQGWWRTDEPNRGMPYKWGGFDTPETFDAGIRANCYAGDVGALAWKRKVLYNGVSRYAVGIDCSGLISRCWGLYEKHSTRNLSDVAISLASTAHLLPGDILNAYNNHVVLFETFVDRAKGIIQVIETYESKVRRHIRELHTLLKAGFTPFRYKGLRKL